MPIHRPLLARKAAYKAMRAHVWSMRLKTRAMRPLERACAECAVLVLSQDAHELMRLAHVPMPTAAYESPGAWLLRMVSEGHMALCAPAQPLSLAA